MYHAEDRLYCYPNSNVLRNRLDLQNAEDLAAFEAEVVAARTAQVLHNDDTFEFSFAFLKELHRHLFQDVYIWAGETRKVHISKGGTRFAAWESIESAAKFLFKQSIFEFDAVTPPSSELFFDVAALIQGVTEDDSLTREILWACWDIDASPEN